MPRGRGVCARLVVARQRARVSAGQASGTREHKGMCRGVRCPSDYVPVPVELPAACSKCAEQLKQGGAANVAVRSAFRFPDINKHSRGSTTAGHAVVGRCDKLVTWASRTSTDTRGWPMSAWITTVYCPTSNGFLLR